MLERDVRQLLDTPAVAHLATLLPDGSPHSTPVWVGVEGDRVAVLTSPASRKARNLRRDPRVALSLTRIDDPFTPVMIRGQVVEWLDGDPAWASSTHRGDTSDSPTRAARTGSWPSSSRGSACRRSAGTRTCRRRPWRRRRSGTPDHAMTSRVLIRAVAHDLEPVLAHIPRRRPS